MEFRELVYITTVAECKSITKAANKLYISQPSLSQFILKVEENMGVKLFDRSTNPISLTYAGERYIEVANQILRLKENLLREFRDISEGKKGRIKIGIPRERAAYMMPIILPKFYEKYPGIEIILLEANTSILIDSVIKGQTDFIIVPGPINEETLKTEFIYKEKLVLICNQDILRQSECTVKPNNIIDINAIQKIPLIVLKKGHGIRKAIDRLFDEQKITPNIIMEISSNLTACRLAAEGIGAAVVPEMTVYLSSNMHKNDIYFFSNSCVTWDIIVAYRKDSYIGTIEEDFFEMSKTEFSKITL